MNGRIELHTGPDLLYRNASWVIWVLAGVTFALKFQAMNWFMIIFSACLLVYLRPWPLARLVETGTLRLYANGSASFNPGSTERFGYWRISAPASRWLTVVRIDTAEGAERLLVCASLNHPDDYRHLLVWSRFPPVESGRRPAGAPAP